MRPAARACSSVIRPRETSRVYFEKHFADIPREVIVSSCPHQTHVPVRLFFPFGITVLDSVSSISRARSRSWLAIASNRSRKFFPPIRRTIFVSKNQGNGGIRYTALVMPTYAS